MTSVSSPVTTIPTSESSTLDSISTEKQVYSYFSYEEALGFTEVISNFMKGIANLFLWIGNAFQAKFGSSDLKSREITDETHSENKRKVKFADEAGRNLEVHTPARKKEMPASPEVAKEAPLKSAMKAKTASPEEIKRRNANLAEESSEYLKSTMGKAEDAVGKLKSTSAELGRQVEDLLPSAEKLRLLGEQLKEKGFSQADIVKLCTLAEASAESLREVYEKVAAQGTEQFIETMEEKLGRPPTQDEVVKVQKVYVRNKATQEVAKAQYNSLKQLLEATDEQVEEMKKALGKTSQASILENKTAALAGIFTGAAASVGLYYLCGFLTDSVSGPLVNFLDKPHFSWVGSGIRAALPAPMAESVITSIKGWEFPYLKASYDMAKGAASYVTPDAIENMFVPVAGEAVKRQAKEKLLETAPWYYTASDHVLQGLGVAATARRSFGWMKKIAFGSLAVVGGTYLSAGKVPTGALAAWETYATITGSERGLINSASSFAKEGIADYARDPVKAWTTEDDFIARAYLEGPTDRLHDRLISRIIPGAENEEDKSGTRKTYDKTYSFTRIATTTALAAAALSFSWPVSLTIGLAVGGGVQYASSEIKSMFAKTESSK